MDAAEERALAHRARTGDREARAALIASGLPWVAMHARRLGLVGAAHDDAVQDGCEGLIHAVDRWDPDHGVSLVTYAWPWIEGAIRRGRARVPLATVSGAPLEAAPAIAAELAPELPPVAAASPAPRDPVLQWRFGFADGQPHSRIEVARRLGLTVAQVRHREARALSRLRRRLAKVSQRAPDGANPP